MNDVYRNKDGVFDYFGWANDTAQWEKNRDGLHMQAQVIFNENKGLSINVTGIEKKYQKAARKLALKIINGATSWMSQAYTFDVADQDVESEHQRFVKEFRMHSAELLTTFLNGGFDPFFDRLDQLKTVYRLQYVLTHITYHDGVWTDWKGFHWDQERKGWYQGDERRMDISDEAITKILEKKSV